MIKTIFKKIKLVKFGTNNNIIFKIFTHFFSSNIFLIKNKSNRI